ncbi:hypothetical protein B0A50_06326 [Salinomyces thailandicus]|uniref:WDR59/RTC1-like RING zinc finger domain-containing protein n=1 Tax=Salinomyces thailandicus TaxID=706561 RepID=A0A4V5N6D5_9PEZI|nr:hypothetical protein B0A50_06326 [Salinomyces thailandica]
MSHEGSRRQSTASGAPPAPPLPAPKPLQRARDAAFRFIGYPSRPPSPQDGLGRPRILSGFGGFRHASLGATQNATASHKTGLEINTIAINEQGTHALLGGKEIFKTVKVEEGVCAEDVNLRTAIRSNPTQASGKPRQIYSIDIADVAWAKGNSGEYVAAATSSGKIILYDLGHAGVPAAQLHEHFRQVHKVTFNPHRGSLLLSGSQDGTVRLWDIRAARHEANALQSKRKYSGQSDGVRDVKWSPKEGVDFAFGTDSGFIQCWDIRNLKSAKIKIPAHMLACNIIDWHPDGRHIASAGLDQAVRVWDFSINHKQKHRWEVKTPYPVMNGRWRPPCESSMPQDDGMRQCTQFVTAYDREHPVIHLWDLRRPAMPFRTMEPYPSAPSDLLWHSQDLLWTVGREGVFLQSDVQHAPKAIDHRCLQSFAVTPEADVNMVTQKRKQRRLPNLNHAPSHTKNITDTSTSPETTFLSRSWADDTLDHSFLSFAPSSKHSRKSSAAMLTVLGDIIPLNNILDHRRSFAPSQLAATGRAPWAFNPDVFKYLARKYTHNARVPTVIDEHFLDTVQVTFDANERYAYSAGLYRLAQSWKIMGFMVITHLKNRVKAQSGAHSAPVKLLYGLTLGEAALKMLAVESPPTTRPISALSQHLGVLEGSSNDATPVARPARGSTEPDRLALPSSELTAANLKELPEQQIEADRVGLWSVPGATGGLYTGVDGHGGDGDERSRMPSSDRGAPGTADEAALRHRASPLHPMHDEPLYALPDDPAVDLEAGKPFVLVEMLREMITHHLKTGDSQTATHLITLILPLLPRTHPLPSPEIQATVQAYTDTYTTLNFLPDEVSTILDTHLQHPIMAGLQPLQIESILSTYHDQLLALHLENEAAQLRKLAYPAYPAVYEDWMKNCDIHLLCGSCSKPLEQQDMTQLKCESCRQKQDLCPYCWSPECPFGGGKIWSMCLLCGHGGHEGCLRLWFQDEESGGVCATGCGCDCVAGMAREVKEEEQRKVREKGKVVSDGLVVRQSKAVDRALEML